ncbi:MAG: hypothetical protein Q7T46_11530 [Polaromonas sp.]|nr:hypothetical protein [Polaromonas sp.]
MTPTFAGEMQLAGWSESHTSGCKVTFWLSSPDDLEAFRALTVRKGNTAGHRFMAALVEIGDDEQPVQSDIGKTISEKPKGGQLARLAGIWCNELKFWRWIDAVGGPEIDNDMQAAEWIRQVCLISSRVELDYNEAAAKCFQENIRQPYMAYLRANP